MKPQQNKLNLFELVLRVKFKQNLNTVSGQHSPSLSLFRRRSEPTLQFSAARVFRLHHCALYFGNSPASHDSVWKGLGDIYNFSSRFFSEAHSISSEAFVSVRSADNTTIQKVKGRCEAVSLHCRELEKQETTLTFQNLEVFFFFFYCLLSVLNSQPDVSL